MDKTPTQWMTEPLRRYAQFTGRARRAEYWWFVLFALLVGIVAAILDHAFGLTNPAGSGPINGLASLALLCPQLTVSIRRLHDIDRSGWWFGGPLIAAIVLTVGAVSLYGLGGGALGPFFFPFLAVGLVYLIYGIVMLVWVCRRGTVGPNRYGPDPMAPDPHVL